MVKNIQINLGNKTFYTLIAIVAVLAIAGIAYAALNPSVPSPGHAISELQKCSNGEILKMDGGAWTCSAGLGLKDSGCGLTTDSSNFGTLKIDACDKGPGNFVTALSDCASRGGILPTASHLFGRTLGWGAGRTYWTSDLHWQGLTLLAVTSAGAFATPLPSDSTIYWRCIGA